MFNKIDVLRFAGRRLPLPGRHLNRAIEAMSIDLDAMTTPLLCLDRWGRFFIEIRDGKDIVQKHIFFQGYFEYLESKFVKNNLSKGQTFLDIGANIGWHSLIAAHSVGTSGNVIAFEPVSDTYDHLVRNMKINGFSQVRTFKYGLSSSDGNFDIFKIESNNCGANSLYSGGEGILVETVVTKRADSFLKSIGSGRIDLCKIDVEGAECEVLSGLGEVFDERGISKIMIEVNEQALNRAGSTSKDVIYLLDQAGFELYGLRKARRIKDVSDLDGEPNVVALLI